MEEPFEKTPEEMKELAIAVVTGALNARALESQEGRLEQFAGDFHMLMEGITGADLFRLASLLGDLGASLVEHMAQLLDSSPQTVMQFLAQQMAGTPITENEDHEHGEGCC